MKKYRIICIENYGGVIGRKAYEVQKRFLGFLWWYNFIDFNFYATGIYNTLEEAEQCIAWYKVRHNSHICKYF